MKTKRNKLFTVAIVAVYIISVLFFVLSLLLEYKNGPENADKRFKELCKETSQNLKVNSPTSEYFKSAFLRSVGSVSDIATIKVEYNGIILISYPKDFNTALNSRSSLISVKEEKLNANDGSPLTVTAAIYLLKPTSIYDKGRAAFFVILVATLLCIFYLVYIYMYQATEESNDEEDKIKISNTVEEEAEATLSLQNEDILDINEEKENTVPVEESENVEQTEDDTLSLSASPITSTITQEEFQALTQDYYPQEETNKEQDNIKEDAKNIETEDEQNKDNVESPLPSIDELDIPDDIQLEDDDLLDTAFADNALESTSLTDSPALTDDTALENNNSEEKPLEENKKKQENIAGDIAEPITEPIQEEHSSLSEDKENKAEVEEQIDEFAQTLGICPQKDMLPALDSELVQAASSEQDITLLIITISDFDWKSDISKEIISCIEKELCSKKNIFSYNNEGCSIIMQGKKLEQSLGDVKNLHTQFVSILAKHSLYNNIFMGLSAKSLRLISANRLINEAEKALEHSKQDKDSPITAFKVDPEKYRKYIASESEQIA